jgi:hypothetical protein
MFTNRENRTKSIETVLLAGCFALSTLTITMPLFQTNSAQASENQENKSEQTVTATAVEPAYTAMKTESSQHKGCKVTFVEPHKACSQSAEVLKVLQTIITAYAEGDVATLEKYVDDGCTVQEDHSHKYLIGKEQVLDNYKHIFERHQEESPLVSLVIDHPYAKVTGDIAIVTYHATKEIGGKNPRKYASKITDVFVKEGNSWKKLRCHSSWKKVSLKFNPSDMV